MRQHGLPSEFHFKVGKGVTAWTTFEWRGDEYDLAVFPDNVNMREGGSLFECYLTREFKNDAALIDSFAKRLDRYLSGGPWEEPDESDPGPIVRFFRRLFATDAVTRTRRGSGTNSR